MTAERAAATRIFLCHLRDLSPGTSRGFDPEGEGHDTIFLVRKGDAVFGWRNDCPHHAGARMNWRKDAFLDAEGQRIMCSAHGALFDIETGICEIGPCLGGRLTPVRLIREDSRIHCIEARAAARGAGTNGREGP